MRLPILSLVVVVAACATGTPRTNTAHMGLEAARARARADSVTRPYNAADIEFMSGMIHHHAQAIEMSKLAPSRGASAAVIRLTGRVINAQTDEIGLMQRWLEDRRLPVPEPNPKGMVHTMGGMQHTTLMPGMLTDEQMAKLAAARGVEFDRHFLTYMIQHHRGAVEMVKALYASPGAANDETVFRFSSDVQVDQTTEIARMIQMVMDIGGPVPTP